MKTANRKPAKSTVVLTTLNGNIDANGNIEVLHKQKGWNLVSDRGGVSHSMKANMLNSLLAKHHFTNNTSSDVLFRWDISIITCSGESIRYDFGTIALPAGSNCYTSSVPYKCRQLLNQFGVSRIMVATMII